VTLTGCLSLIGLNAEGIAVGNTNLVTRDVRPGVQYLSVLHRALRATTLDEAVDCIRSAPRAAGHYYYVAGPDEVATGLECSAAHSVSFAVQGGTWVHCNHALSPEIAALEVNAPAVSTAHRQRRLESLLKGTGGSLAIEDLKRLLADHEGGEDRCLCRHDHEGVSTNAVVILSPATREIHACRGQAHLGDWLIRRVGTMPGVR
jgi:isopenicillin-N N-acyltransferase-like protein